MTSHLVNIPTNLANPLVVKKWSEMAENTIYVINFNRRQSLRHCFVGCSTRRVARRHHAIKLNQFRTRVWVKISNFDIHSSKLMFLPRN